MNKVPTTPPFGVNETCLFPNESALLKDNDRLLLSIELTK